jgi:hypothetical protein
MCYTNVLAGYPIVAYCCTSKLTNTEHALLSSILSGQRRNMVTPKEVQRALQVTQ